MAAPQSESIVLQRTTKIRNILALKTYSGSAYTWSSITPGGLLRPQLCQTVPPPRGNKWFSEQTRQKIQRCPEHRDWELNLFRGEYTKGVLETNCTFLLSLTVV